jgi:RNA ligase
MTTATDRLHLRDLFSDSDLAEVIDAGLVRKQSHPELPLFILNYTASCQYSRSWNHVTKQCRGLIVDGNGFVVARPWPKFFNYGEHEEGAFDLNAPAVVTDKLDGSLGSPASKRFTPRSCCASDTPIFGRQMG